MPVPSSVAICAKIHALQTADSSWTSFQHSSVHRHFLLLVHQNTPKSVSILSLGIVNQCHLLTISALHVKSKPARRMNAKQEAQLSQRGRAVLRVCL